MAVYPPQTGRSAPPGPQTGVAHALFSLGEQLWRHVRQVSVDPGAPLLNGLPGFRGVHRQVRQVLSGWATGGFFQPLREWLADDLLVHRLQPQPYALSHPGTPMPQRPPLPTSKGY